jgi:hypothetical protein
MPGEGHQGSVKGAVSASAYDAPPYKANRGLSETFS